MPPLSAMASSRAAMFDAVSVNVTVRVHNDITDIHADPKTDALFLGEILLSL